MALRVPAHATRWTNAAGSLDIWLASRGVVVQRLEGHATFDAARAVIRFVEPLLAPERKLTLFNDWEAVIGYDSAGRIELTSFTQRHRSRFGSIHVLVRSKLLAMGIAVANIAIGGIDATYASREAFENALSKAVQRDEPRIAR